MNKAFLCAMFLVLCLGLVGCVGLGYVPSRAIGTVPPGTHDALSLKVDLPKRSHSWEIGLWSSGDSTNIVDMAGKHLLLKLTNVSNRELTLSPGVRSSFERITVVQPGQTIVVHDAAIATAAQILRLFGCDAHEHGVSFHLNLEFDPPVQNQKQLKLLARGRDAL